MSKTVTDMQLFLHRLEKTRPDEFLTEYVPDLFKYKSVLYIGIERYRMVFIKNFLQHNYKIDLLEIWKPHVDYYRFINSQAKFFNKIVCGDVSKVEEYDLAEKYDVVFWFHGPEHVEFDVATSTINLLKKKTGKVFVCVCPFGVSHSPARGGNKFNLHRSALYPDYFLDLDMESRCEGDKRIKSWWRPE